ncbi:MAG: sulfite exporter TauE/SafE family protein [Gammaproteobacteria bacterium]|nr:sulfite exporter TauE/SafE family protein [Gammaproteobacteria bacterium]MBU1407542.1 sulfite exporter TauE/SafE family protein [Gammaproteobacteria bacterium]MBU1531655.1 sulfite exporter TauE/SafE family protein [Gammaproteobacteria bacterium]
MELSAIFAGLVTGLVLGLFGSGGSIIALPALLYLLHVEPKSAIAMSLGVVAVTATVSALDNWRRGRVDVRIAFVFGLFGVAGTFAGARLGLLTPVVIQLGLFALVMYAAAWRMLKPVKVAVPAAGGALSTDGGTLAIDGCRAFFSPCMGHIALHGIGVGVLTGLVGVGGGFLIVPALVLLSGIPMKTAVGTSLAIVAAKSYAGFAGYMGGVPIDYAVMGSFTAVTIIGSFAGAHFSTRISHDTLKKAFAWFLVVVATYILFKSVIGV